MSGKEELDEKTQKLVGESLSFEEVQKDLNNTSPLQMSKKLIEYELFDQQSSIDVMDKIYEEFEDGGDVVDGLVLRFTKTTTLSIKNQTSSTYKQQEIH